MLFQSLNPLPLLSHILPCWERSGLGEALFRFFHAPESHLGNGCCRPPHAANIGGVRELMQLAEAFRSQPELRVGPGQSWPTGHEAELQGQATPSICLEDSRWRIQGIKVLLAVTSQRHEDSVSLQDLSPAPTPHPRL